MRNPQDFLTDSPEIRAYLEEILYGAVAQKKGKGMTKTTRTFIDLADLLSMQFNCRHCSATVILSLADQRGMPSKCPNCSAQWGNSNRDMRPTEEYVVAFKDALKSMIGEFSARHEHGFTAAIEVRDDLK